MNVLIIGATGGTGRELTAKALQLGYQVSVLVRKPQRMRITHERLRVLTGDVLEPSSIDRAVRGQDAVLCALGHKRWLFPTRILSDGTRNLIEAMKTHGVRRLICETSLGLGSSIGRMGLYYTGFVIPFILPFYYYDKRRQEVVVRTSGLDWTIVRPGAFSSRLPRGTYRHGLNVGSWLWTVRIARADVADFMLKQLTDHTYIEAAPGVAW